MRLSFLLLAVPLAALGCTSDSAIVQDSGATVSAEDGSTFACTSVGGTCVPYAAPTCPREQQNTALCESVILLCCLPAGPVGSGAPPPTDAGALVDATQATGSDAQATGLDATQTTGTDAFIETDAPGD